MARRELNKFYVIEKREAGKSREWITEADDYGSPKLFYNRKDALYYITYLRDAVLVYRDSKIKFIPLRVRVEVNDKRYTRQNTNKG